MFGARPGLSVMMSAAPSLCAAPAACRQDGDYDDVEHSMTTSAAVQLTRLRRRYSLRGCERRDACKFADRGVCEETGVSADCVSRCSCDPGDARRPEGAGEPSVRASDECVDRGTRGSHVKRGSHEVRAEF